MNYILDTNIILSYAKATDIIRRIDSDLNLFSGGHELVVSTVTLGKIDSLKKQLQYGRKRVKALQNILKRTYTIDINVEKIIKLYGDIDAYSQGKLANKPLGKSARNMGKNDLWIAATAAAFDLTLVTMDKDFDHLQHTFLNLKMVKLQDYQ